MDKYITLLTFICFTFGFARAQSDGCTSFKNLNSSSLLTDNTGISNPPLHLSPGWYRYTGTLSGVMSTSCPNVTNQCGAKKQAWLKGQLPSYSSGLVDVDVCIRTDDTQCCQVQNTIQVQNCNSFYVYNLTGLPPDTHYCFNSSAVPPSTVKTTSTTTTPNSATSPSALGSPEPPVKNNSQRKPKSTGVLIGAALSVVVLWACDWFNWIL
ncbi:von Willebrand factor D and EGF domain-containing protein-like [Mya arenaria]|uniref:von Willebrand factor D and EGF domain-containing protein-like n=1 Tax=Mya arenaria TaxID=6604 RepID=UPI0022E4A23E|nr:von Willebrand factor D and EGF domain-containing protein-like [Mya arenaria]